MAIRNDIGRRKDGILAFMMAAATAPTAGLLLAAPCGLACGGCPLGGACLAASPLIFGGVLIAQAVNSRRFKALGGLTEDDEDSEEEAEQ